MWQHAPIIPVPEDRAKRIPGAQQPANLAKWVGSRLSVRCCLNKNKRADNWSSYLISASGFYSRMNMCAHSFIYMHTHTLINTHMPHTQKKGICIFSVNRAATVFRKFPLSVSTGRALLHAGSLGIFRMSPFPTFENAPSSCFKIQALPDWLKS